MFWFNVAYAVVLVPVTLRLVPESSDPDAARLDLPGLLLGVVALGAAVFAIILGETSGYTTAWIDALFAVAAVAAVAFVRVELRSPSPMLNLDFFGLPAFSGALSVAFALYFGIFSIFFFTALYLEEVVGYSGYRAAGELGPMAAALIGGSWLSGRWVARQGPRLPMAAGCAVAAAGILITEHYLPAHPSFGPLAVSLAVAGLGFGVAVVPVTTSVLGLVPPEHSGMAASATNTSRELGAVFGVAVLGSLVNANLTTDLVGRLHSLGIPSNFYAIVIHAIETGTSPSGGKISGAAKGLGPVAQQVEGAAYAAFHAGLTSALVISAILILLAGAVSAVTGRGNQAPES